MTYKITPCSLRLATAERDPSSLFYFALKLLGTLFPPSLAKQVLSCTGWCERTA